MMIEMSGPVISCNAGVSGQWIYLTVGYFQSGQGSAGSWEPRPSPVGMLGRHMPVRLFDIPHALYSLTPSIPGSSTGCSCQCVNVGCRAGTLVRQW